MDLVKRAKELGIRGNLANWKEETLKRKIEEAEKINDISEKEVEAIKEREVPADMRPDKWQFQRDLEVAEKEVKKKDENGKYKYLVKSGHVRYCGVKYAKDETFLSSKANLDKAFEVIKV